MSMKNPVTPSGIDPMSFRFVAQCHKHCVKRAEYVMIMNYTVSCELQFPYYLISQLYSHPATDLNIYILVNVHSANHHSYNII
jgi:hypothetical protein